MNSKKVEMSCWLLHAKNKMTNEEHSTLGSISGLLIFRKNKSRIYASKSAPSCDASEYPTGCTPRSPVGDL
jgi:hypothetical protein